MALYSTLTKSRCIYVPRFRCYYFLYYACISLYSSIYISYNMMTQMVRAPRNPGIFDKRAKMTRSVYHNGMILVMVIPRYWTHISANFYEYLASRFPDIHPRRILYFSFGTLIYLGLHYLLQHIVIKDIQRCFNKY